VTSVVVVVTGVSATQPANPNNASKQKGIFISEVRLARAIRLCSWKRRPQADMNDSPFLRTGSRRNEMSIFSADGPGKEKAKQEA
jgi:hypothetical protein